ncbi:MAG TPA: dihydrolipoamide acetyltransferase family protein [Chondromyces sp.]|nr:dihydrolipoamide acetyltransferase family protein [Chondromyces sp.]
MSKEILIPKLGVEMTSATIDEWKIEEGNWVDKGESVVVLQTEKVSYEYEALDSDYLHIVGEPGEEYKIGEQIALLFEDEKEYQSILNDKTRISGIKSLEKPEIVKKGQQDVPEINSPHGTHSQQGKRGIKASPLAKKIAKDKKIDLSTIQGSGPTGAIIKRDVIKAISRQSSAENSNEAILVHIKEEVLDNQESKEIEVPIKSIKKAVPLKGMRKAIANNMVNSLRFAPQLTDINELEVDNLVNFRTEMNRELSEEIGFNISFNDLFIKAVAIILREIPILNSSIIGEEIVLWEDINIGVAVAVEGGLVVPVIKNADKLSIYEIRKQLTTLIEKAKNGDLSADDMTGGTFTITNIGSYGGYISTPILNYPEAAILGVGKVTEKPVVRDGQIVIGKLLGFSFTYDHRIIDGMDAGKFQNEFKRIINNPKLLLVK